MSVFMSENINFDTKYTLCIQMKFYFLGGYKMEEERTIYNVLLDLIGGPPCQDIEKYT